RGVPPFARQRDRRPQGSGQGVCRKAQAAVSGALNRATDPLPLRERVCRRTLPAVLLAGTPMLCIGYGGAKAGEESFPGSRVLFAQPCANAIAPVVSKIGR